MHILRAGNDLSSAMHILRAGNDFSSAMHILRAGDDLSSAMHVSGIKGAQAIWVIGKTRLGPW